MPGEPAVPHLGASVVVNKTVTVNDRTYGSIDELPPDVRQLYKDALKSDGARHPKTSLHVSVNLTGSKARNIGDSSKSPAAAPQLIESSSLESRIRELPTSLAILVAIGLVLWWFLGR